MSYIKKLAISFFVLSYLMLWARDIRMQIALTRQKRAIIRHEQLIQASLQMASDVTQKVNNKHITPPIQRKKP